jgi:hypothetical protein
MCTKNSADWEREERCLPGAWEGKIKGRGTCARRKPGLHVGWRGTRLRGRCAVEGTNDPSCLGVPRASHATLRANTLELVR